MKWRVWSLRLYGRSMVLKDRRPLEQVEVETLTTGGRRGIRKSIRGRLKGVEGRVRL